MPDRFERGREVIARQVWAETYERLSVLPAESLGATDLERLAVAAYLLGDDVRSAAAWEAAHRRHLEVGDRAEAARCSFWLALGLMLGGQMAHAGGWLSRAQGVIGDDLDCSSAGYLLIPELIGALEANEPAVARDLAIRASEIAARFDDTDLKALAELGRGQALIALGENRAGVARLDEVMLSVSCGDVGPIASGIVYCAVILECMQIFDLARAAEWTDALSAWCDAQPGLVPYRGQCLVHRSQLQQAAGDWVAAADTIELACGRLAEPPHPALGLAYFQGAELRRLVGDFDAAAADYRRASRYGFEPMPGLALLELARGDISAAAAGIRRALADTGPPTRRPMLLAAAVEIFIAADDLAAARLAADELAATAQASTSPVLRAMAEHAVGAVVLGEGAPALALVHLRAAAEVWQRLQMPYEAARTGVAFALSCTALGDSISASIEFDNARHTYGELGARPDLARLRSIMSGLDAPPGVAQPATGPVLSSRELEVLTHVASGKTNREIAADLVISPHTASRHVENIFAKLGVRSRAAATAYAYEHGLL